MQYSEILSMLDAEIARLEKARELLVQLSSPTPTRKAPRVTAITAISAVEQAASEQEGTVAVQVLRPRRAYGPRTKRVRATPAAESALRTSVPAGPVAVSANDVRRLESQKTGVVAAPAPAPAAPLAWRAEADQTRRTGDLLQRFMEMGSEPEASRQP